MAISVEKVKQIQAQTIDLGELILSINPVTEKEWDAFEKLVSAHKNLMKIDSDSLLQLPLPLAEKKPAPPKFRPDCPRCSGTGEWTDPSDKSGTPRACNCNEVEDFAWLQVRTEWEKELAPAES